MAKALIGEVGWVKVASLWGHWDEVTGVTLATKEDEGAWFCTDDQGDSFYLYPGTVIYRNKACTEALLEVPDWKTPEADVA